MAARAIRAAGVGCGAELRLKQENFELYEAQSLPGRWIDSQELFEGDEVVCLDGAVRAISRVEAFAAEGVSVCNLTVRDRHTFAVAECGLLLHNESWCDILEKTHGRTKPKALEQKLAKINAARPADSPLKLHGHHIVMKEAKDEWSIASRKLLQDNKVSVLETQELLKGANSDQLHNISYAINGADGIHSERYAKAVHDRLMEAVDGLKTELERSAAIEKELGRMRKILEGGKIFW